MKCKYCKAKITAQDQKCPACKKLDPQPEKMSKKRKMIMISCVAGLALLGAVLLMGMLRGWDVGSWFRPKENTVYYRKNYSVSTGKASRRRNHVVATLGSRTLTNGQLQIYYWRQVNDFADSYSDSAAYLGLDFSGDLAKQAYLDGSSSWQQYFLINALQSWQTNCAFADMAEKAQYALPEDYQQLLDNLEENLLQTAQDSGYATVDEMVKAEIGPSCTAEDYAEYLRMYYTGYMYFREQYDAIELTDEEIIAYYEENAADYEEAGITKDGSVHVNFRHIMLYPENGTMYVDGSVYYSDEAWDQCQSLAETLLTRWRRGEATEESFAELAKLHSDDTTTASSGGLYSNVVKGDMKEEIEDWCFDESRRPGDSTIVRTDYGYHIIYFVEAEESWFVEARSDLLEIRGQEMVNEVLKNYTFDVQFKEIVLGDIVIN